MKKLKLIFLFAVTFLIIVSLTACGTSDPEKNYPTAEPLSTSRYKNIFKFNSSEINYEYFTAKKVFIYNDFSADIDYEITGRTLEKEGVEKQSNSVSKKNIIDAIDLINKDIYYYDSKYKLYEQENRVLYIDEDSIEEVSINENSNETTKIVLNIHVTNLNYVSTYYKLISLEDYLKAETDVLPSAKTNNFINTTDGKLVSLKGMKNPENFKVLVLEKNSSTSPLIETEFIFESKIIAYYKDSGANASISKTNPKSITVNPSGKTSYIAVMCQIDNNSVNWAILGPAIGIASIFLILLTTKIILSFKKRPAVKGG